MLMDSKNCLIKAGKDKLVVIKGLDDFIVMDEADVLMIYPKSKEQEVKQVTQAVEKQFHSKIFVVAGAPILKKVLIVANSTWNIYNFRLNLIEKLLQEKHEVSVLAPVDEYLEYRERFPQVRH